MDANSVEKNTMLCTKRHVEAGTSISAQNVLVYHYYFDSRCIIAYVVNMRHVSLLSNHVQSYSDTSLLTCPSLRRRPHIRVLCTRVSSPLSSTWVAIWWESGCSAFHMGPVVQPACLDFVSVACRCTRLMFWRDSEPDHPRALSRHWSWCNCSIICMVNLVLNRVIMEIDNMVRITSRVSTSMVCGAM